MVLTKFDFLFICLVFLIINRFKKMRNNFNQQHIRYIQCNTVYRQSPLKYQASVTPTNIILSLNLNPNFFGSCTFWFSLIFTSVLFHYSNDFTFILPIL